jgi:hypothetical protein
MAKPKQLKVDALQLHIVIRALQKFEEKNPGLLLSKQPISKILTDNSDYATSKASIPNQVKIAIMHIDGDNHPDPTKLDEGKNMSDYEFSDIAYISLTEDFQDIAKQYNPKASISASDVEDCTTVQDCIDLVATSSQP